MDYKCGKGPSRRDFIKTAGAIGGAAIMAGMTSGRPIQAASAGEAGVLDELLKGVSDIHVHAAPDVKARAIDELSFAREAQKAGSAR